MTWPGWPYNALLLIAATGVFWALSVALEWRHARHEGDDRHVSPAWRSDQAREAMREDAPQFARWRSPRELRSLRAKQRRDEAGGIRLVKRG